MAQAASEHLGESLGTDFFSVREQFTDEQWSHFIAVRRFVVFIARGSGCGLIVSGARTTGSVSCAWYDARPASG